MTPRFNRWLALCLGLMLAWLCPAARADSPVTLFQSFAGNVNFTGTEATMRTSGTNVCSIIGKKTVLSRTLSSIPSGATVLAAHLYWAGSATTPDYQVTFEGKTVTAQRQYTGIFSQGGTSYAYFGGAADVTAAVKAKSANGNGTYSFRDLAVSAGSPWCDVEGVLGGFALLVIYSHPSQTFRVLNLYEGFQFTRNSSLTLSLSNFKVPTPIGGATGRVGHITWEGDQSLQQQGETLAFNGTPMTDALNPAGNQFASRSNIDGYTTSYGVDFDAYDIVEPIIKAGDTTATTTYASGQDLVWLNAEIVAVPNVPVVDLSLSMTRTGEALAGTTLTYLLTVTNNGPNTESGPITVTDTIPPGMSFSSAVGTGWACSATGQTATCTHQNASQLAKNASLPVITLKAQVLTSNYTEYTNTATVSGPSFDNISGNNTATNTAIDSSAGGDYVFTIGACADGIAIGAPGSNCQRYTGPFKAALAAGQPLYITRMNNGLPAYLDKKNDTHKMRFSLSCVNPIAHAGIRAQFAGQTLPLCTGNGAVPPESPTSAWTGDVKILFPGGQPSGRLENGSAPLFLYADVGWVKLNLIDMDTKSPRSTGSASFVSHPTLVKFTSILNSDDGVPNGTDGFARAGEPFKTVISVVMDDGDWPPNFGKEAAPYGPVAVALGTDADATKLTTSFALQGKAIYLGTVDYNDVGSISLSALVAGKPQAGYAAGTYFGVAVPGETMAVGKFYPGYYNTEITSEAMLCLPRMNCPVNNSILLPSGETIHFVGAEYSGHPFEVTVTAFTMKDTPLTTNIPAIRLDPVTAPGPSGTVIPTGGSDILTFGGNTIAASAPLVATPTLTMPIPYTSAVPRAGNWRGPLAAYMRAVSDVSRVTSAAKKNDPVSSNRGAGGKSVEHGIKFIHGRLQVANSMGSELLRLPMRLNAQYWTGTSWDNNPQDSFSEIDYVATFSSCKKGLATDPSGTCKGSDVVWLDTGPGVPTGPFSLDDGLALVRLRAPGATNSGSTMVKMTGSPTWLPSTVGQAVFGTPKSPYIYIREVY